jgi:RND family efflux transporter MFP subunit
MKTASRLIAVAGLIALGGCKSETEQAKAPPPRPVLTIVAKPAGERLTSFAGTIQPRYQTELGFRVLGRIIARNVDVGDLVKPGQTLAQLDPLVLDLAVRANEADLAKARSQLSNTTAAEARAGTLLGRQVSSQADFDTAQQAREASAASVQQAEANLAKAREQRSYASLNSDLDGVVTTTDAEVGQTVSPGKKVMTLARTDARDAVVDLPEEVTRRLSAGAAFAVELQADPAIRTTGKVREIAPQADASTRTRRVRITLDEFGDAFRLGATISASPRSPATDPAIDLPASALLDRDGATRVWVVDAAAKTVASVPVQIARRDDGGARISGGLTAGARVVVAGVNSLKEGQVVKLDERDAR